MSNEIIKKSEEVQPTSKDDSSLTGGFSIFMSNFNKLIGIGKKRQIERDDCGGLPEDCHVEYLEKIFTKSWNEQLLKSIEERSLIKALLGSVGYTRPFIVIKT
jgi:hypothetical protein